MLPAHGGRRIVAAAPGRSAPSAPRFDRRDRLHFGGYSFDPHTETLWLDETVVPLRPKSAAVLKVLLDRGGEVVSKDAMLAAVWPDGFVGDDVLAGCVRELRAALGDDAKDPRFIATVHRRGYRMVAPISLAGALAATAVDTIIGRDRELESMRCWWNEVRIGVPQVAFIAGEAGSGKSRLVDHFVEELRRREHVIVGRGHCVEQAGGGEPYLPFLDALGGLCREVEGDHVREVLRLHAPSWLLQLPWLVEGAEQELLLSASAKPARMMRELADALHALSRLRPVVLVCEDLHAADRASTELLGYLARHPHPARLLVVGTYRPAESFARGHPLRRLVGDLRGRQKARHLDVDRLTPEEVHAYVVRRMAPRRPAPGLVADVTARTDGNASFVVALVDHLIAHDLLVDAADGHVHSRGELGRTAIPATIRASIDGQLDEHGPDVCRLLEVAAVAGREFTAEAVSAGLGVGDAITAAEIEDELHALARTTALIQPLGPATSRDGSVTGRYRFRHSMCREVLEDHAGGPARRATLRSRIGSGLAVALLDDVA